MASKLVLVVALLAASQASPVLINGVFYRDGRSYAIGQASGTGLTQTSSNVRGDVAQSFGSTTGGAQLARDGLSYPGQGFVQTQAYNGEVVIPGEAKAVAQNGGYHHIPAPATIVSYQNFAVPSEVRYEVPINAVSAVSRATSNGIDDSSSSSVQSFGNGIAVSDAQTRGVTSTHAKSSGHGYGTAISNNKFNHGTVSTSSQTSGLGSVVTSAKSNNDGAYAPLAPAAITVPASESRPTVIDAKTQKYVPTFGTAGASAKTFSQKPISWRFGTYYNVPSSSANAQVNSGVYPGYVKTSANTNQGFANANANLNEGYGALKSTADEASYGIATVNADATSGGYDNAKSTANINGRGNVFSSANINPVGSNSKSTADISGPYGYSRTNADANASGPGTAKSSAYFGSNTKRADASVNSFGSGLANAKANVF